MYKNISYIKYLSARRVINAVKVLTSYGVSIMLNKPVVWGLPMTFSVEPTNSCNLKCPECPSGLGQLTRPRGYITIEGFKKIVDEISGSSFYIQLFFQGEPLLNKNLAEMIRYAHKRKIYTSISTNGLLLSQDNADLILKAGPDKIIFSMDGLDEKAYKNYRIGGSYEKADSALRLLARRKKELGLSKPVIELQFIVMKQNEHQKDNVTKYGREAGADKVALKTMQVYSYEDALKFLPDDIKFRRYDISSGKLRLKGKLKNRCFALWRTSVVTWDGRVVPCCFDKDARFEIGNIYNNDFEELWNSKKYNNFRKVVLSNRPGAEMCRNCTEGLN
jgi:radical SAM protein with 4Fe4S-binding SPASM domain